jgi:hypothetical protein
VRSVEREFGFAKRPNTLVNPARFARWTPKAAPWVPVSITLGGATDVRNTWIAIVAVLLGHLAGCGFVHDEEITGPYRLVAVDISEQMIVCFGLENGNCVGRIPETVFSVGWNERFIVAKQHPQDNKAVTNYFVLDMTLDNESADPSTSVIGPLSVSEFEAKAVVLGLPSFTKTIKSLQ